MTVQKVRPAISKPKARPTKVHKAAERTVRHEQISDCPTPSAGAPGYADFGPMLPESLLTANELTGGLVDGLQLPSVIGGGGGGSGPSINPVPPVGAVPQPGTWVMMVAGFGFVGLALRRPGRQAVHKR